MGLITTKEYQEKLNNKAPDFECLGEYQGNKTKILHRHKICGYEWDVKPNSLLSGQGCPNCKKIMLSKKQRKTHEQYLSDLAEINPEFEVLEEYKGNKTEILHRHKTCGYEWSVRPNNMLDGQGCPNCRKIIKNGDEEYKKLLSELNSEFESLEPYIRMNESILHRHKPCGYEWKITPGDILCGYGCPNCSKSKGEVEISNYLNKIKEPYEMYHTYEGLYGVGGGLLNYDFYLPKRNILIEFQGLQHEKPVEYFGGQEKFEIQQEHDKRKREYAKEHNIELLEIWYWDFDNIKQILESRLLKQSA